MKMLKKLVKGVVIVAVILVVLFIGMIIWAVSSDDNFQAVKEMNAENKTRQGQEVAPEPKPEDEIEEPEPEAEKPEEEPVEDIGGKHIGDTLKYTNGLELTIEEIGITKAFPLDQDMVYVKMELQNTNNTDEAWISGYTDFALYIDDYQVEITRAWYDLEDRDTDDSSISVNPGRKAKFDFKAVLPSDYDTVSDIEVELPGSNNIIFIKKDGVYTYGQKEVPTETSSSNTYGLYESWFEDGDLYKIEDQNVNLTFAPINNSWGPAAEVYIKDKRYQYLLYMEDERHGYLTYMEDDENIGSLSFTMDGVVVDCGIAEIDGTYWY